VAAKMRLSIYFAENLKIFQRLFTIT